MLQTTFNLSIHGSAHTRVIPLVQLKPSDDVRHSATVAIAEDGAGIISLCIASHSFSYSIWSSCYLLYFLHGWYIYVYIGVLVYSFAIDVCCSPTESR